MNSIPREPCMGFQWKEEEHINVLESRMTKVFTKYLMKNKKTSWRIFAFVDSKVSISCAIKGRARSTKLKKVWRGTGTLQVAGNIYAGYAHGRSKWNRGDAPTRKYPIPPPSRRLPRYLRETFLGNTENFEKMFHLPPVARGILEWMRFILLLRAGDVHPNPGPGRRRFPPRPPLPVTRGRAVKAVTRAHRSILIAGF